MQNVELYLYIILRNQLQSASIKFNNQSSEKKIKGRGEKKRIEMFNIINDREERRKREGV